jgi:hypothetical protein
LNFGDGQPNADPNRDQSDPLMHLTDAWEVITTDLKRRFSENCPILPDGPVAHVISV